MNPLITRWKHTPCINSSRKKKKKKKKKNPFQNWKDKLGNKTKKKKIKDLIVEGDIGVGCYALFPSAKGPEILCSFGNQVVEEFDDDSAL